jgi:hypothetical protein
MVKTEALDKAPQPVANALTDVRHDAEKYTGNPPMTNTDILSNEHDKPFAHFKHLNLSNRIIDYEKLSPSEIKRYKRIEKSQLVKSIRERRFYCLKSDVLHNKQEDTLKSSIHDNSSYHRSPVNKDIE